MNRDSRGYYYRSVRRGDRVTREYIGAGLLAELEARLEEKERDRAELARFKERQERAGLDELDKQLAAVCAGTDELMRQELQAAGYHQHARGQWRKRRERK